MTWRRARISYMCARDVREKGSENRTGHLSYSATYSYVQRKKVHALYERNEREERRSSAGNPGISSALKIHSKRYHGTVRMSISRTLYLSAYI